MLKGIVTCLQLHGVLTILCYFERLRLIDSGVRITPPPPAPPPLLINVYEEGFVGSKLLFLQSCWCILPNSGICCALLCQAMSTAFAAANDLFATPGRGELILHFVNEKVLSGFVWATCTINVNRRVVRGLAWVPSSSFIFLTSSIVTSYVVIYIVQSLFLSSLTVFIPHQRLPFFVFLILCTHHY